MVSKQISVVYIFLWCKVWVEASVIDNQLDDEKNTFFSSDTQVSNNPSCQSDILRICRKGIGSTKNFPDLMALECILNSKRLEADEVSASCSHVLWSYRLNITSNDGFKRLAGLDCTSNFEKTKCWKGSYAEGENLVTCLINANNEIFNGPCTDLLMRLESVIFSDYTLIERFANKCKEDIDKFQCGRNQKDEKRPHSQGETIECLSNHVQEVSGQCAVEILRIAELQADDFHLDRAVYFACRDDREKFCERVTAGNGRVYKCLFKHKSDSKMSSNCRFQLLRREKIGWKDYKATGIRFQCKQEIKKYGCKKQVKSSDVKIRLSEILLCLENAHHNGNEIGGDCADEISIHRAALMQDYHVTPEILASCSEDIAMYCKNMGVNGKTLHCLMGRAQVRESDMKLSDLCRVQIENNLKIADVASDWKVDPVLRENCQEVVEKTHCGKLRTHQILDCLMNLALEESDKDVSGPTGMKSYHANIQSSITEECETTLLQIQYFLARDFSLDYSLYKACGMDAKRLCHARSDWAATKHAMDPSLGPLILSCLYRNTMSYPVRVHDECASRVKQTMRQRALSVKLMPEIEDACMADLSDYCSEKTGPGEELHCLQENIKELEQDCYTAVANFTQLEMQDPTIDPVVWKHCREIIKSRCDQENSDEDDIMDCLVDIKHEIKNKKCKASVVHVQILELQEVRFSPRFKQQCEEPASRYCRDSKSVVHCLSRIIRDDIVEGRIHRIEKGCRKQVRYLLMSEIQVEKLESQGSGIYALCSEFIDQVCKQVAPGDGRILECLRQNRHVIKSKGSPSALSCAKALFHTQQDEQFNIKLDAVLNDNCRREIEYFCPDQENALICLKLHFQKEGFGSTCQAIVKERLIEQNSDIRLSLSMHKACKSDIKKFCADVKPGEGRIIECLKEVFIDPKSHLSSTCRLKIEGLLENAAESDIRYDKNLYESCGNEIHSPSCKEHPNAEDCLKLMFHQGLIRAGSPCYKEVVKLIHSIQIDIHIDPVLNEACSIDLMNLCDRIPPGEGRLVACLMNRLDSDIKYQTKKLSEKCFNVLSDRSKLFQLAGKPAPRIEGIQDLVSQVKISPQRNYLLIVSMSMVGVIFIFGLFCGRATNRRAYKDK